MTWVRELQPTPLLRRKDPHSAHTYTRLALAPCAWVAARSGVKEGVVQKDSPVLFRSWSLGRIHAVYGAFLLCGPY